MDRVGTVVKIAQGLLVVRSDSEASPSLGTTVIDEHLDTAGTVVDIIGPVSQPFVIISPQDGSDGVSFLNQRLYTR